MNYRMGVICVLFFSVAHMVVAEGERKYSLAIELLNRSVVSKNPEESIFFFYDREVMDDLFLALRDERISEKGRASMANVLGHILIADKEIVKLEEVFDVVRFYETEVDLEKNLFALGFLYVAVAKYGSKESLDFLLLRMDESFWGGHVPEQEHTICAGPSMGTFKNSAIGHVIDALSFHPSEEAKRYLEQLRERYEKSGGDPDSIIARELAAAFRPARAYLVSNSSSRAKRMYEMRFGVSPSSPDAENAVPAAAIAKAPEEEVEREAEAPVSLPTSYEPINPEDSPAVPSSPPVAPESDKEMPLFFYLLLALGVIGGAVFVSRSRRKPD